MSVHRAGSYFGVPHSTLEYKVKERNKLRLKNRHATLVSAVSTTNFMLNADTNVKNIESFDLDLNKKNSSNLIKKNFLNVIENEINNFKQSETITNKKNLIEYENQTINNAVDQQRLLKNVIKTTTTNLINTIQSDNLKINTDKTKKNKSNDASLFVELSTNA